MINFINVADSDLLLHFLFLVKRTRQRALGLVVCCAPTFPLVSAWFCLPSSLHTFKAATDVGSSRSTTSDFAQLSSRHDRSG